MSTSAARSLTGSILLADDDAQLATFLSKSLETEGYSVHTALDEGSVLEELNRQNYQLIILDLNFGQTDGLTLLERLRTQGVETPVMVLSARNRITDRIQSLNLGADDYVTKPFSFQELAARANALLRRKTDPALSIMRMEDLELDPATRKVHRGGREIKLSPKECDLLLLLLRRGGHTVSRQELLRECWGHEEESDSNLVDVYVNYLRKKVDFPGDQKLIYTVRGEGYRLGKSASNISTENDEAGAARSVSSSNSSIADREPQISASAEAPLEPMVHSVTHDLAQPLTSLRCFLEVLALDKSLPKQHASDLKLIEQQADRAIALTKAISALVREPAVPAEPWVLLDSLINDILDDFSVLVTSGLLSIERHWDAPVRVTSKPVMRQLLLLLFSKLAGRNTRPLSVFLDASTREGRCRIILAWKANDALGKPLTDAKTVFVRDLQSIESMVSALQGTFVLKEGQAEVSLELPAPPASTGKTELVQ